jgi:hypothetical protein
VKTQIALHWLLRAQAGRRAWTWNAAPAAAGL